VDSLIGPWRVASRSLTQKSGELDGRFGRSALAMPMLRLRQAASVVFHVNVPHAKQVG
jgi:hypothetical protein